MGMAKCELWFAPTSARALVPPGAWLVPAGQMGAVSPGCGPYLGSIGRSPEAEAGCAATPDGGRGVGGTPTGSLVHLRRRATHRGVHLGAADSLLRKVGPVLRLRIRTFLCCKVYLDVVLIIGQLCDLCHVLRPEPTFWPLSALRCNTSYGTLCATIIMAANRDLDSNKDGVIIR